MDKNRPENAKCPAWNLIQAGRCYTGQGTELCLGAVSSNEFRKDSKTDFLHISIFVP